MLVFFISDRHTILLLKSKSSIHKDFKTLIFLTDQNFPVAILKPLEASASLTALALIICLGDHLVKLVNSHRNLR